ncbi:MAG: DUF401 family protein [Nitrospirae bacterium]|nr:DUF401 family protein [Nitrospirota bacterium]
MSDIIKIISVFFIMVLLLKRRWNLGIVMFISSLMLALLYAFDPFSLPGILLKTYADKVILNLILSLTLIRIFENIMRKNGIMQEMMTSFKGMVHDRRVLMASMPGLIGLLPSMGGALFSAPMVEEASKGIDISSEKKAFINYWFRHPWEFILPLYPGLVLASAMTQYALRDLIIFNLPYALCLLAGGIVWGLRGVGIHKEGFKRISGRGSLSFLPLVIILFMVIILHLDLSVSIGAATLGLFIVLRYSLRDIVQACKEGFSWDILLIILGIMAFKAVLGASGAVAGISVFFSQTGVPLLPVLFVIPFISGFLTGLTFGFVGSTFPIVLGFEGANNISAISFAFASGFIGVLVSPVHLCLVLTREYFKADMAAIYMMILKAVMLILAVAVAEYMIFAP